MARLRTVVTTEGDIALAAATPKTVLQIVAPANQRIAVRGFSVNFDGTASTAEPVTVEVLRQTTAGTMTAATPAKEGDPGSETIQMTAQKDATAEPTAGEILRRYTIHPQSSGEWRLGYDEEIHVGGGTRLGIRLTAPAAVNATAHFACEE